MEVTIKSTSLCVNEPPSLILCFALTDHSRTEYTLAYGWYDESQQIGMNQSLLNRIDVESRGGQLGNEDKK